MWSAPDIERPWSEAQSSISSRGEEAESQMTKGKRDLGHPTVRIGPSRVEPGLFANLESERAKMQASDRFNINSQLEHLQAKYVGTGHADLSRFEWAVNIQRDSYASYIGHYPMLAYFAIAENESIGRERYNFMQKMLLPCGLPPEREDD
ncbi:unnamed protein product [Brassica napus]|uniref:(rape) hypothetical protein n=1 Tax=Brassica napus TaxID=3708 RepID=A0A816M4A3_BRANA|nr:unnamed protein product [Brassica napus]